MFVQFCTVQLDGSVWSQNVMMTTYFPAFGFCEYKEPESTLRALRLLHDLQIGDKSLLVKVDAKTKAQLDEWKAKKKTTNGVWLLDNACPVSFEFFPTSLNEGNGFTGVKCVLFLNVLLENWRRRRWRRGGPRWRDQEEGSNCQRCYRWIDAGIRCRTQRTFTGWGLPAAQEKKGEKGRGRLTLKLAFASHLPRFF